MDNIISPRTFFTSNKSSSAYDDVFGARPRLPLPTLAPRLEDYSEIFVDASRSFSIPLLDLPILTGADHHSNHFHDYAEIFDDSSDEPWNRSPAQSGALFDPSDKSLSLSDDDAHHSLEATDQFNASYNNNDNSSQSIYGEGENCSLSSVDDPSLNAIKEHDQRVAQEKQHTNCDFINLSDNHENFTCKPFMTVSDISLRTKPSLLPPPSRPPPALSVQKGDSDTSELEPKASKSYALERLADDSSSLSSDFELVAATLSPEGTENGNKDVDNYDGDVEWGEGNEYFEVIENNISKKALDITEDCDIFLPCQVLNEAQGLEKQRRQPEVTNEQKEIPNKGLNDRKRFQEKVVQSKLTSQHSLNKTGTEDFHQFVECGKLPIDDCETLEVLREGEGNLIEMDAKGVDIEKKSVVAQMARQNSGKQNQNIPMEEFQRRLENVEGAKNMDQPLSCEVEKDNEKLFEVGIQVKNELMYEDSLQQARNEKEHKLIHEREVTEERNRDAHRIEGSDLRFRRVDTDRGHTSGFFKTKGHISLSRTAGVQKEPNKYAKEIQPIEINEHEKEVELTATTVSRKQYNEGNERLKVDLIDHEGKPIGLSKHKNKGIAVDITCRGPLIQDTPPFISKTVHAKDSFIPCPVIRESSTINGAEKHSDDTLCSIENATNQKIEIKNYNNFKDDLATKDQKVEERIRREIELENEHIRKIEEEKEREREREKDRMAVDKAALEACERSYTEARERAAVDRVTAEVRQRAIAGARERMENSSMETKLRIERAAIERATSEARERAAGKSMSQIAVSQAHFRVERSASFKYSDMRQSSLSIDTQLKNTGITSNLRYSYSFGYTGADSESPQRCKARLERYRRTAERAENALAEKNMRDLLVQREREEINRVAETLDSEIKRWSSGKEANLRALLSTLQYILGPDSGWQPVPLTEVITCAAVKRAYRKATLCVHPDKLQQRGATIHQKYICEKVFDLLKEAWNRFNSEEM